MSKKDFLVELLVEEIPARFQTKAIADFSKLITDEFEKSRIQYEGVQAYITPRRLVFSAKVEASIAEFTEEKKGPQITVANEIIEKFLQSIGATIENCIEKNINGKTFLYAIIKHEKQKTADFLGEIVKRAITNIYWLKSMHWGIHSFNFVRPIRNIMCVFDEKTVNVDMLNEINIKSVNYTFAHRFMGNKKIFATSIDEYLAKMRDAFVIVDQDERRKIILEKCNGKDPCCYQDTEDNCVVYLGEKTTDNSDSNKNQKSKNVNVVISEDLLEEVVGLVEYPVVMIGKIAEKFMRLPDEVIITTMQTHQRYFPTTAIDDRKLAPYFVFVANVVADDKGNAIRFGNERVLTARLSDALFFFENDLMIPLERRLEDLKKVAFNEKLGTVYDRTLRIIDICGYLYEEITQKSNCKLMLSQNADQILKRAALLAKCDLTASLVCEFTELQGIIGAHYALYQGESEEVCNIIRDQYKMVDELYSPLSALYSMADKIDAITGLFAIGKIPTGSKDPFALRRAAIGIVKIIMKYGINIDLRRVIEKSFDRLKRDCEKFGNVVLINTNTVNEVMSFILERLRVVLKESGIDHEVINAVLAIPQDIFSIHKKTKILDSALKDEKGKEIINIYKRAENILQGNLGAFVDVSLFVEEEEKSFYSEIEKLEKDLNQLERENLCVVEKFEKKLKRCLAMRDIMSEFFNKVLVNTDDETIRKNRIGVLAKFVAVFNNALPEIAGF